jgi:ABC-type antimicrobial peptide transport system permease subunit
MTISSRTRILGMRETTFPGMSMHLPIGMLATIAVLGVVIGVLAAIVPARRAAKLDPAGRAPLRMTRSSPR